MCCGELRIFLQSSYICFFVSSSSPGWFCSVEHWLSSWRYLRRGGPVCSSLFQPLERGEAMIAVIGPSPLPGSPRTSLLPSDFTPLPLLFLSLVTHHSASERRTFYGPAFRHHMTRRHIWICDAAICPGLTVFSSLLLFQSLPGGSDVMVMSKTI